MRIIEGKSVFPGIAIGKIYVLKKKQAPVARMEIQDPREELCRLNEAREQAVSQLKELYEKALKEAGEQEAAIFEVHQMMLGDGDYLEAIRQCIHKERVNGEYAVSLVGKRYADRFAGMDDEYMKARAADIQDITDRLIRNLQGRKPEGLPPGEPVILAAEDLSPSETVQLDKSRILAFVTEKGSIHSHSAILARTMNIPALTGISLEEGMSGQLGVADGRKGCLVLEPEPEVLEQYRAALEEEKEKQSLFKSFKGLPTCTRGGRSVHLYANIGSVEDVESVLEHDGEGVGLLRSEFLYLEKEDYPSEEELFLAYKEAAERMGGKKVIIRTVDVGADKQIGYFHMEEEENPAMGLRGIRVCLEKTEVFKTQLRAILRAGRYGNISVMYPMITSLEEVRRIKGLFQEAKEELLSRGISFNGELEQGIMIETPAAAMISDLLAGEVDFFSIGTNDLTQYTLAVDRQNPRLEEFYDPHHEAVLRLVEMVAENAHRVGIWAGICGELAGDLTLTQRFVEMGLDELSVPPSQLLPLRKRIRELP